MTCPDCTHLPARLEEMVGWRHFHTQAPCWWWVREVLARHRGYALPGENVLEPRSAWAQLIHNGLVLFQRVSTPQPYDGVLLHYPTGYHIGLVLDAESFLHVPTEAAGVCLGRFDRHAAYLRGVYRFAGSA